MYHNGLGAPMNDAEALKWYREAAERGFTLAQNNLGIVHALDEGVPEDYVKAYMW